MRKKLFELQKTDHGIDGWDAKTTTAGYFTTQKKVMDYLESIDWNYYMWGSYYSNKIEKRNCMGAISYRFVPVILEIDPVNKKKKIV